MSPIRSRSIANTQYGVPSGTNIGRPSISSMRRGAFDIIISAKANTISRKGSFNNCWPRPAAAALVVTWFGSKARAQPPAAAHGIDVDDQGNGTVTEQRLYQLIRQPKPIADRQFEIEFLDPGVEAFAFTFG